MPCRRSSVKLPGGVDRRGTPPAAPGTQSGAALIVALLVFALCTALVVAMESEFNRFYQRGANILLAEQAYAYLRGAEELATLALLADYDAEDRDNPRDDLLETWAQPPPPYALDEGGWMAGCLRDLQGRFNLNALAARVERQGDEGGSETDKPRFTPAQAQFIRLLQALGEPQLSEQEARLITEAVTDWLDADLEPAFDGAEDDYYFGQTPGYRAANRAMASVSELRAVAGVTPELYRALEPWVTVWPQQPATLNIHTAGSMVLRSINVDDDLSPLSVADGEALQAQQRPPGPVLSTWTIFLPARYWPVSRSRWSASNHCWARAVHTFCCRRRWKLPTGGCACTVCCNAAGARWLRSPGAVASWITAWKIGETRTVAK